jgi:uracil-DNA glycosylase family 4
VPLSLSALENEWHDCQLCPLSRTRTQRSIVFGGGLPQAKFLFVYPSPSAADEEEGGPFAGRAAQLIQDLAHRARMNLTDCYATPLVGCRPTQLQPATETDPEQLVDRDAASNELEACRPRVHEIIYRLDPQLIFAFGVEAWRALVLPKDRGGFTALDKAIGELFVTRIPGKLLDEVTYDVMPLLSINQILATPSSAKHGSLNTTAKYLHKGAQYVSFIEQANQRDAEAAGHETEDPRRRRDP